MAPQQNDIEPEKGPFGAGKQLETTKFYGPLLIFTSGHAPCGMSPAFLTQGFELFRVLTVDRGRNSWNAKDTNYPVASRHQAKSGCIVSGPRGRFSRFVWNVCGQ